MAKESQIKKAAIKILEKDGWIVWCPAKVKFYQNDIFGLFDCVAVKDSEIRYIQWTSAGNLSTRKKKIEDFFEANNVFIPCEVWGYRGNNKWRYEYI